MEVGVDNGADGRRREMRERGGDKNNSLKSKIYWVN